MLDKEIVVLERLVRQIADLERFVRQGDCCSGELVRQGDCCSGEACYSPDPCTVGGTGSFETSDNPKVVGVCGGKIVVS